MQTIFEPKKELPFDVDVFDRMEKNARNLLRNAEDNEYTQAIVVLTAKGNEYSAIVRDAVHGNRKEEDSFFAVLTQANDTEISRVLCMWQDGNIDIPYFYVREKLCALNSKNAKSGIFVQTKNGFSVIPMLITMK